MEVIKNCDLPLRVASTFCINFSTKSKAEISNISCRNHTKLVFVRAFKYHFHVISGTTICATCHKEHIKDVLLQKHVVLL